MNKRQFKETLEKLLSVGDLRSIGKSNEIVELTDQQQKFDVLFEFLKHPERAVIMRAADSVEKISLLYPEFLQAHKKAIIELSQKAKNKELKWYLAQLLSRLNLTVKELGVTLNLLTHWALDKKESKIVRVNALQSLQFNAAS